MAPYRRQETRDLAPPEPLSVAPARGDTYVQPERPVQNDDMARLGQSLSAFSGALAGLYRRNEADLKRQSAEGLAEARARAAELKKQQDEYAKAEAYRYTTAASQEELSKGVASGTVPYADNPVTKGIYNSAVGQNIGAQYRADLERDLGPDGTLSLVDEEGRPIPIDKFLADRSKPYSDRLFSVTGPGDLHGNEALYRSVESTREMLLKRQQEQVAAFSAKRNDYVMSTGMRSILSGDIASMTPEQVGERLGAVYGELKSLPGAANVKWNDLDDLAMGTLKKAMQAPNLTPQQARNILKVLDAPRKDSATGQALPGLGSNPRFADDVSQLRAKANDAFGKEFETAEKDKRVNAALEAFHRGNGDFDFLPDEIIRNPFTGKDMAFSADSIRGEAVTRYAQGIRDAARKQNPNASDKELNAAATSGMMDKFVANGTMVPQWKASMENAVRGVGTTMSMTNPDDVARLQQNANLYTVLRDRNPAYVEKLLDPKARDFYETYHTLRGMGWASQAALEGAGRAIGPDAPDASPIRPNSQAVIDAANKFGKDGGAKGFLGGREWFTYGNATNISDLRTAIAKRAQLLVKTQGISPEAAIDEASKTVGKDVPAINGVLQFNRSPLLTLGREPIFKDILSGIYDQHQKALEEVGVTGPDKMSVRYVNGIWQVTDANGMPLMSASKGGNAKPITFTDGHVLRYEKLKEEAAASQVQREGPVSQTGDGIKNFFIDLFSIPKEGYVKLPSQNK